MGPRDKKVAERDVGGAGEWYRSWWENPLSFCLVFTNLFAFGGDNFFSKILILR